MIFTQTSRLFFEEVIKVTWQQIRKLSVINLVCLKFCLHATVNRHRICETTTNRGKVQQNTMSVVVKLNLSVCSQLYGEDLKISKSYEFDNNGISENRVSFLQYMTRFERFGIICTI